MQSPESCGIQWRCPPEGPPPAAAGPRIAYLAIRYVECLLRPVRVHPAGCGCDETICEYSRVLDSFELAILWKLPESHKRAKEADAQLCQAWKTYLVALSRNPSQAVCPVQPCSGCEENPWLILATITIPDDQRTRIVARMIHFGDRRVLYNTATLQGLHVCK
jgi:hypothetical protein